MINIVEKLDQETAKRIKSYPSKSNRASECGHPCIRFLVLSRLQPEKKELHDIGLQRIFDEGNLQESAVLREIQDAGFNLVEQQRPFEMKEIQLTGRIDAKIAIEGKLIPLEIKSCSPNSFQVIKNATPDDIKNSKYSWIRKYPAQIMSYCLMDGKETGIIIFKNKTTGEKCQKEFAIDYDYMEGILKKLERVNECVAKNEIPPVEPIEDCKSCGFAKTVCFPGQDYGPGFEILTDQELIIKLDRREALKNAVKEYEEIDKELKEAFKGRSALIGDFKIESKEIERKEYTVKAGAYWKTSIEKI